MDNKRLYEIVEELKEVMGVEVLLDDLVQALSSQELKENLEYIDRMNDTNLF